MPLPDGRVDASSAAEVTGVLGAVHRAMGAEGLADLLQRLPGVTYRAGRPGGLFRSATPAEYWLGTEDVLTLEPQLVHAQVVNGVVLHRTTLAPGVAPATIAGLVVRLVTQMGSADEASVALTAARDTVEGFQPGM